MASRAALALLVAAAGTARADEELHVALYAPWGGPADAEDRHALVGALETSIADATGLTVSGKVYSKYKDFEAAAKGGKVDYAVMDLAPALRGSWDVLGTWTSGDSWSVVSTSGAVFADLEGRRLALAAKDAPASTWLLETWFLRGEIKAKSFFSEVVSVPVPHDAARAIELGKADCAIVRGDDRGGAGVVLDLGTWPELALVRVTAAHGDVEDQVVAGAKGALSGTWSSGAPSAAGNPAQKKPVFVSPRAFGRKLREFFTAAEVTDPVLPVTPLWISPEPELP